MSRFHKLSEREVYAGRLISVAVGTFRSPEGHTFEREKIRHSGAVTVVPVLDGGQEVVLVRQYRSAVEMDLLEVPAGRRDKPDEPPEETARRELIEEAGYRAGRLELLGQFYASPGFTDELALVYLAQDLEPTEKDLQGIEEQHMTVEHVALADVPQLIRSGAIVDGKTIIGLCLAREALKASA